MNSRAAAVMTLPHRSTAFAQRANEIEAFVGSNARPPMISRMRFPASRQGMPSSRIRPASSCRHDVRMD